MTLTGLNPGSSYHFQVVASNSVQQDVGSGDNQFTTDQQITGAAGSQVTVTDSGTTDGDCPTEGEHHGRLGRRLQRHQRADPVPGG